jgi:hypothetical protein
MITRIVLFLFISIKALNMKRLETVRFVRLFTYEGDTEYTGRGNTEHRGLKARVLP